MVNRKYPFVIHGNYFGPGNPVSRRYRMTNPPVDKMDRIAYRHDLAYARYGKRAYTHWNKADKIFVKKLRKVRPRGFGATVKKYVALGLFGLKRRVAPRM